jgi:hypothetical protein
MVLSLLLVDYDRETSLLGLSCGSHLLIQEADIILKEPLTCFV